jgi:hypothetical protein
MLSEDCPSIDDGLDGIPVPPVNIGAGAFPRHIERVYLINMALYRNIEHIIPLPLPERVGVNPALASFRMAIAALSHDLPEREEEFNFGDSDLWILVRNTIQCVRCPGS